VLLSLGTGANSEGAVAVPEAARVAAHLEVVRSLRMALPGYQQPVELAAAWPRLSPMQRAAVLLENPFLESTISEFARRDTSGDGILDYGRGRGQTA